MDKELQEILECILNFDSANATKKQKAKYFEVIQLDLLGWGIKHGTIKGRLKPAFNPRQVPNPNGKDEEAIKEIEGLFEGLIDLIASTEKKEKVKSDPKPKPQTKASKP